jgi:hypothetical protein
MAGIQGTGINGAITLEDIINYQNSLKGADELRDYNRASASLMHGPLDPQTRMEEGYGPSAPASQSTRTLGSAIKSAAGRQGFVPKQDGDRIRRLSEIMAMTPEERSIFVRQENENKTISDGPEQGSRLAGRALAPDNVPLEDLTPEQRRMSSYVPGAADSGGAPRAARGGSFIADQNARGPGRGAYVPRSPDYNAIKEAKTAREKAAAYGIDITKYDPNSPGDEAALENDINIAEGRHKELVGADMLGSENIDPQDRRKAGPLYRVDVNGVQGGGYRYRPNQRAETMLADRKREMFLRDEYAKFQREANADRNGDGMQDVTYDDFAAAYDLPGENASHQEKAGSLRKLLTNKFRAERASSLSANVDQRVKNENMARLMGTTPGHIAAANEIKNAAASGDPEQLQAALLGIGVIAPRSGMGNAAIAVGQQNADVQAARAAAGAGPREKKGPIERSSEDLASINAAPFSVQRVGNYRLHYRQTLPQGSPADPMLENKHVVSNGASGARESAMNPGRTPEQMDGLREWTRAYLASGVAGNATQRFRGWARQLGLDSEDPENMALFQELTGENPRTWSQWAQSGRAPSASAEEMPSPAGRKPRQPFNEDSSTPIAHPGH